MTRAMQMPVGMDVDDDAAPADIGAGAAAESHHRAAEQLDMVAMLRGAEDPHAISGARRAPEAEVFNLAALGSIAAALTGLVVMPLPMGAVALCLGGKALLADQPGGRWMGVAGLLLGVVNIAFWAVYTMGFFGDVAVA